MACKNGKLKHPVGGRRCKKSKRNPGGWIGVARAARRDQLKAKCKWGPLKHAIGKRICKRRPAKASVSYHKAHSPSVGRYGRRRR